MVNVGDRYGRLVVTAVRPQGKYPVADVICDCGNAKTIDRRNMELGRTKSCGCLNREATAARSRKYPEGSRDTYNVWFAMISRCTRVGNKAYVNYGGRGITVSDDWKSFEQFYADMGVPEKGLTLERVDNEQGYSAQNCVWASRTENLLNRRNTLFITFKGEKKTLHAVAEEHDLPYGIIHSRYGRGDANERLVRPQERFYKPRE